MDQADQSTHLTSQMESSPAAFAAPLPLKVHLLWVASGRKEEADLVARLSPGYDRFHLVRVPSGKAATHRLQEEGFDGVLVGHHPPKLDAPELIAHLRTLHSGDPIVALLPSGHQTSLERDRLLTACLSAGADQCFPVDVQTPTDDLQGLCWALSRAIERQQLLRAEARWNSQEQQRLRHERCEGQRWRDRLADLAGLPTSQTLPAEHHGASDPAGSSPKTHHPEPNPSPKSCGSPKPSGERSSKAPLKLWIAYRDLLRVHVMLGNGQLNEDADRIAETFVEASLPATEVVRLHLGALEELTRHLGSRSPRHLLTRADALLVRVLMGVADGYRRNFRQVTNIPCQQWLPGLALDS